MIDDTPPLAAATDETADAPLHLLGVTLDELREWLVDAGEAKYRATQIAEWIYEKGADRFEDMTVLSKPLRAKLAQRATIMRSTIVRDSIGADLTRKLLTQWPDGALVETVWIPDSDRNTACLSSQVGCPVGCKFCASGVDGVQRDLTAGEIVEQAFRVKRLIEAGDAGGERPSRLSNIVMMGTGEPLANYEQVIKAIRIINADWGLNIGARRITISTVGLPKQIRWLAHEELQLNLALSLHAPDEKLRQELIPWGKVPLNDLLDACRYYFKQTGREITLEYVLLSRVNDRTAHAVRLAKIAYELRANVNLLRWNPVPGLPFERPDNDAVQNFQKQLRDRGVNVHVRRSRGRDIDAACGQLRRAAKG